MTRRSSEGPAAVRAERRNGLARRVHFAVMIVLQAVMMAELLLLIAAGRWAHVFLVAAIMTAILVPELLRRGLGVEIPSEIQIAASLFVFATLFLGEVRDYYEKIWWWDLVLHTNAGLLTGLLGFLIVDVLNRSGAIDLHMRPSFVALFAFFFALGIGSLWEVFEFAMDRLFGLTMQKPMLGDPSGLTDTMWDLIVNAAGAAVIAIAGWRYIRTARRRHVDTWIARMIRRSRHWGRAAPRPGAKSGAAQKEPDSTSDW